MEVLYQMMLERTQTCLIGKDTDEEILAELEIYSYAVYGLAVSGQYQKQ